MAHLLDKEDLDEGDMGDLFDYLRGRSSLPDKRSDKCIECGGHVLLNPESADYVCVDCGICQPGRAYYVECWEDHERITVPPREGYKPIHHWHERLAQYHLQESAICPAHWSQILEVLMVTRPKHLSKETLRRALRTAKLQRYNENWLQIINRITGYVPPALEPREMLLLDRIFEGVSEPFRLFKAPGRKNLLNYNFLLYRLFELIGRDDCLKHFPQLKTASKWQELDRVWAQICDYHDWQHPPLKHVESLAVPMSELAWERVGRLKLDVAWQMAMHPHLAKARPRQQATHSYANRKLLNEFQRTSNYHKAVSETVPLPRSRHAAMKPGAVMRRLRAGNSKRAGAGSATAAKP